MREVGVPPQEPGCNRVRAAEEVEDGAWRVGAGANGVIGQDEQARRLAPCRARRRVRHVPVQICHRTTEWTAFDVAVAAAKHEDMVDEVELCVDGSESNGNR